MKILINLLLVLSIIFSNQAIAKAEITKDITLKYKAFVENTGWCKNYSNNGELAGTTGKSLKLQALQFNLQSSIKGVKVLIQTHVQDVGWNTWKDSSQIAGSTEKGKRLEAIKIKLVGAPPGYHIEYQTHVQNIGWQNWTRDGEIAGTTGKSLRIEAIKIRIIKDSHLKYCIDFAKYNSNTKSVEIEGWALSLAKIKSINVIINNKSYSLNITGYRPDVFNAYPQYNNKNSGFNKSLPLNLKLNATLKIYIEITEANGNSTTLPLEINNSILDSLKTIGSNSQVILVTTNGYGTSNARIRTFEKFNGNYKQILNLTGYIGKYGFAQVMSESEIKSPRGKFTIGTAFGRFGNPGTKLSFRNINSNDYWVDDSYSLYYNTWQTGPSNGRWYSAENMNIPAYNYGFVINYNTTERIPGKGSAIFFHVSSSYTAGCTGTSQANVISILKWLDPSKNPIIIQCPENELYKY